MRKCKILLILTGGTIGTAVSEQGTRRLLSVEDGQEPLILQRLREARPELSVDAKLRIPFQILSEHMTLSRWEQLLDCLREEDLQSYDVVAITHGSDTLAYTAAFLDEALYRCPVPVFLVASQRPPEDPESNATDNFLATVDVAMRRRPETDAAETGMVYITYKNSDGVMYLHRGRELRQCEPGSDDFFSEGMTALEKGGNRYRSDTGGLLERNASWRVPEIRLRPNVLIIRPYVGIRYDSFSLEGIRAVLHTLYHSSTAPKELTEFAKRCQYVGVSLYIIPCDPENINYETTKELMEAGARPIQGLTEETAYARLLLGTEI